MKLYENHPQDSRVTEKDFCPTITARYGTGGGNVPFVMNQESVNHLELVRKLTPIECERLQGFPDDWTKVPFNGKPIEKCPDSHRYRVIGNSWAVPVVHWIGSRIQAQIESYNQTH